MPRKARSPHSLDFEKSMQELEELVEKMEDGDLSLEDSLKYFEQGVTLTRLCQQSLKEAEQKVAVLLKKDEQSELGDFDQIED